VKNPIIYVRDILHSVQDALMTEQCRITQGNPSLPVNVLTKESLDSNIKMQRKITLPHNHKNVA
jgi:hypothetical protein